MDFGLFKRAVEISPSLKPDLYSSPIIKLSFPLKPSTFSLKAYPAV
jgi:hypothetical protein